MTTSHTPVVMITGTSSGIGLATALACARAGWSTVATLRNTSRATALTDAAKAAGVTLDIRSLDVTDPAEVTSCVDAVVADYGHLDAVVNNAGAAHIGTLENDNLAEIRACMEVNFFGVVQVSRAALPHLRASRGRLLTISSVGGAVGQPFNEAYCAAKFAVEGFMQSLAPVARTVGVQVGLIEPGAVSSEFVANAKVDVVALSAAAGPYAPALDAYLQRTLAVLDSGSVDVQTPTEVAEVITSALTADTMPIRIQSSSSARSFVALSLSDLDGSAVQQATLGWVDPTH